MISSIITRRDVLLRSARRIAISVSLTVGLTYAASFVLFGTDPDALLRAASVTMSVVCFNALLAVIVSSAMSISSSLLVQQLTLTRAELWRLSRTDQLTGLLNRRGFDEAAISALTKAHDENLPTVALMCDIDRFKTINDQYGHEFGDAVLVQIAEVLNSFARDHDMLIGRQGGEEFAVLVIGATAEQALQHAEKLRRACAEKEVTREGSVAGVTISIGLAASSGAESLSNMLGAADQALYAAKREGRNRVVRADLLDSAIASLASVNPAKIRAA